MHILLPLLGVLAAFGYWYFALKNAGKAANEIVDMAGRARGAYKRSQFRKKADASVIDAITDPRTAAVVMAIVTGGTERPLSARQEAVLLSAMASVLGVEKPDEELTFAKWAAAHVVDPNNVSMRFSRLWTGALAMNERRDLVDLVHAVAAADGAPSAVQEEAIQRLKARLAITS
ncbi:MAG TPA: hypothetical protein VLA28_04970 [Afifellaceae bacterium]|nr:hypothetical protein [Afifellaceae bacterium]